MSDDDEDFDSLFEMSFMEWHDGEAEKEEVPQPTVIAESITKRYPHECPKCGGPAYVGLTSVDCLMKCDG